MADAGAIGVDHPGPFPSLLGTYPTGDGTVWTGAPRKNRGTRTVSGTVKVAGVATGGLQVYAHAKLTGEMVGYTVSAGDGTYSIKCGYFDDVYVVAFDPTTYQALVFDQIAPG